MMAVNWLIPYIPKLDTVNVPPWYSSGLSLPSRALEASDLVSAEMEARPLDPTSLMMGVMRPVGVATATQMSARLYLTLASVHGAQRHGRERWSRAGGQPWSAATQMG